MMHIEDAMRDACRSVGIIPPQRLAYGRWIKAQVDGKANGNGSGRVMINADRQSGVAFNWVTGERRRFSIHGAGDTIRQPRRVDPDQERRERERAALVAEACRRIVAACETAKHPYLERKGLPEEMGLVIEAPGQHMPRGEFGDAMRRALPQSDGPLLVVPGRIGRDLVTVQFIAVDGAKKNILGGHQGGACHRISTGSEVWVCEGIATALTVRAALRMLGRSATVLSAFAAANVAKVAAGIPGSIIAADHDRPLEQLHGLGTGEFYARQAGCVWTMPPVMGDFNDWHQAEGLRAVAMHLRGVQKC